MLSRKSNEGAIVFAVAGRNAGTIEVFSRSHTHFEFRIQDFGFAHTAVVIPKSAVRNPKFFSGIINTRKSMRHRILVATALPDGEVVRLYKTQ